MREDHLDLLDQLDLQDLLENLEDLVLLALKASPAQQGHLEVLESVVKLDLLVPGDKLDPQVPLDHQDLLDLLGREANLDSQVPPGPVVNRAHVELSVNKVVQVIEDKQDLLDLKVPFALIYLIYYFHAIINI